MSTSRAAISHHAERATLAARTAQQVLRLWMGMDRDDIRRSWTEEIPVVVSLVTAGQQGAAAMSDPYLSRVLGGGAAAEGVVAADRLAGVASDGRSLPTLLMYPVWVALHAVATGLSPAKALARGAAFLDLVVRTLVADAGRAADLVGMLARPAVTSYVRVVRLPACARCIILAGREYGISTDFLRHPRCDCTMEPVTASHRPVPVAPSDVYAQMTQEDRQRVFGEAGAQAIDLGGDIAQVVNARRGMDTAAGHMITREGTTRRGAGRRALGEGGGPRLMPEQILAEVTARHHMLSTRPDAPWRREVIDELRRNGFLVQTGPTASGLSDADERPSLASLIPEDSDDFSDRRGEIEEALSERLEGEYAGLTVSLVDVMGDADEIAVSFAISQDGLRVGTCERTFARDADGDLYASHDLLVLRPQVRGQGFAEAWNGHLEEWYRESGFDRIEVHADIDVGGYTWARQGFDFHPDYPEGAEEVIGRLENLARDLEEQIAADDFEDDASRQRALAEAEAAFDVIDRAQGSVPGDEGFPSAFEVSQCGRQAGDSGREASWIGKAAMLGSDWQGVKPL